jgi:hypothetical protein
LTLKKITIANVGQVVGQLLMATLYSLVDNLPLFKVCLYWDEKPSFIYDFCAGHIVISKKIQLLLLVR